MSSCFVPVSRAQVSGVLSFPALTSASLYFRLPNKASIFRAELHAISLALSLNRRSKKKNFIIFQTLISSLEAISGFKLEIGIVQNMIKNYTHLATVAKQSFYAGYLVMSIFVGMRGLTLQQNQLFLCPLQIRSFQHVNWYHVFPSSVWTNGKIYGTVAREINFILFTPRLALSSIAEIFPATIPSCSTNCELVILVSLTHTYWVVMTPQPVNLAEFHSQ